jgi:hypothetical protein
MEGGVALAQGLAELTPRPALEIIKIRNIDKDH